MSDQRYMCFQVNQIGRTPIIGKIIKKTIQFICSLHGHSFDGDWGYSGGLNADAWCRHCDHFTQIPKTSIWFQNRISKSMMDAFDREVSDEQT